MSSGTDFENAVAITRDIFWVGFHDKEASLHCNPYLIKDDEDVIVVDPGSIPHFPIVMRKILDLVKPQDINYVIIAHQDPDVCGNLAVLEDVIDSNELKIVSHSSMLRLLRHYGITSPYYQVDHNNNQLILKSGRTLDFISAPYLHSPGAIMTFDRKTKSLFSGDVFGSLTKDNWDLFANSNYPEQMATWHQAIIPSNNILSRCLVELEKLDIDRILPQHGSVIEKDIISSAFAYLKNLPCGVDLMEK